jgi:hypothetical protein
LNLTIKEHEHIPTAFREKELISAGQQQTHASALTVDEQLSE